MRQAGVLAAAAQHALEHHIDRLADDHALAARLAEGLQWHRRPGRAMLPQTNIVFVTRAAGAGRRCWRTCKAQGVLATGLIGLRFVTHLDVDRAGIDRAIAAVRGFFKDH